MDQERPLLVEAWLGGTVLVEYVGGQLPETAAADTTAETPPMVKTARFVLENYNGFGIEVRPSEDSEPQFLAWGAVLRIAGTDQETPEDQRERAGGADGRERSARPPGAHGPVGQRPEPGRDGERQGLRG